MIGAGLHFLGVDVQGIVQRGSLRAGDNKPY
jgi:hypothetical protein